ncbi:MAG: hypothetical protein KUG81_02315 [Gammaproteobacteria bacterium]|nr:hypothetical protein [Gammaproteobacteria bacterium]
MQASDRSIDSISLPSVKGSPTVSEGKVVTPAFRADGVDRATYYLSAASATVANLAFAVAAVAYIVWIYFFLDWDHLYGGDEFNVTSAAIGAGLGALLRAPGVKVRRKEVIAIPKARNGAGVTSTQLLHIAERIRAGLPEEEDV